MRDSPRGMTLIISLSPSAAITASSYSFRKKKVFPSFNKRESRCPSIKRIPNSSHLRQVATLTKHQDQSIGCGRCVFSLSKKARETFNTTTFPQWRNFSQSNKSKTQFTALTSRPVDSTLRLPVGMLRSGYMTKVLIVSNIVDTKSISTTF